METEPEQITIIEGPPPEFRDAEQVWALSLIESSEPYDVSLTQVRSFKGEALLERCKRAWGSGRSIYLDFPTYGGLRRKFEIIAAKFQKLPEGDMLNLWVRHKPEEIQDLAPRDDEAE